MLSLSPGILYATFQAMELIAQRAMTPPEFRASFPFIEPVSSQLALELAEGLVWSQVSTTGLLELTVSGQRVLSLGTSILRSRRAIEDYVRIHRPAWASASISGRQKLRNYLDSATSQVFIEAGLFEKADQSIIDFWDRLAADSRGIRDNHNVEIGRKGEQLSLAFERQRTGVDPKWVALESNEDGYDVLSVVDRTDKRLLSIEVKTTAAGLASLAYFTRNEWETASVRNQHCFHFWDVSKFPVYRLAVLEIREVEPHIALDRGDGLWNSLTVPLRVFQSRFETVQLPI